MALATRLIGLKWYFGTTSLIGELDVDWDTSRLVNHDSRFREVVLTDGYFDYLAVLSIAEALQLHQEHTHARRRTRHISNNLSRSQLHCRTHL